MNRKPFKGLLTNTEDVLVILYLLRYVKFSFHISKLDFKKHSKAL